MDTGNPRPDKTIGYESSWLCSLSSLDSQKLGEMGDEEGVSWGKWILELKIGEQITK